MGEHETDSFHSIRAVSASKVERYLNPDPQAGTSSTWAATRGG